VLAERATYAAVWLATYAPEQFVYKLQDELPEGTRTESQKKALSLLAEYMSEDRSGEEIHARLHELKTEVPIEPKELFAAIYQLFLSRNSGPKAGWFLSVLPRDFVVQRLREASQ
jgi:lysyl-tRNA synthetase class 1